MTRSPNTHHNGFTLIEVAVALAILGWVLGAAIFLVSQYADERLRMRERFLSNQVAWNQLMEEYRFAQGWQSSNGLGTDKEGISTQGNQQWRWEMDIEAALGQDLYRYQISVAPALESEEDLAPTLSLYLVNTEGQ